jgi:hypothetical protein
VGDECPLGVLSIITGGGEWVEMTISADPLYQHLLLIAEKKFWRCVQSGETPQLFGVEPPRPRLEAVRVIDMSTYNSWAELAVQPEILASSGRPGALAKEFRHRDKEHRSSYHRSPAWFVAAARPMPNTCVLLSHARWA